MTRLRMGCGEALNARYYAMSEQLKQMLIRDEGEVLHAYEDSEGYLTIGVGHLIDKRRGGGISKRISRLLLEDDIRNAKQDALANLPFISTLDPVRRDVVFNMVFNMGISTFLEFRKTIQCLRNGDYKGAAREMLDSKWARQVGPRATRLAQMMESGEYV